VHIPFCAHRCDYCDFATWTDRGHLIDAYVDACVTDVERQMRGTGRPATSVFFGGGTPSLIPAAGLARILDAIDRDDGAEVTVECNPDSVNPDLLATYQHAGVNRISFGVQSMQPHVLAELGRTHDPAGVATAVQWARAAGFEHLNLDLIYGTPCESVADWRATLDGALALSPDHISAYALTVEPGTPLGRDIAAGGRRAPDDDDQAEKYEIADDVLGAAGLPWYEVSNWARPGHECRHNLLHWSGGDYLAIGCAAHGHRGGHRWWNVRTPERYITAVSEGIDPTGGGEDLDERMRDEERLVLSLRTSEGATVPASMQPEAERLVDAGLLLERGQRVVLTRRGRLLASDVTARLLVSGERAAAAASGTRYE
jgi:oxygen-independent coproporphyrinogen-3 oxidase